MYLDTKDLITNISSLGVKMHCLYGIDVDTVERLVYKDKVNFPGKPTLVKGEGDGTVNLKSAEVPLKVFIFLIFLFL